MVFSFHFHQASSALDGISVARRVTALIGVLLIAYVAWRYLEARKSANSNKNAGLQGRRRMFFVAVSTALGSIGLGWALPNLGLPIEIGIVFLVIGAVAGLVAIVAGFLLGLKGP